VSFLRRTQKKSPSSRRERPGTEAEHEETDLPDDDVNEDDEAVPLPEAATSLR